MLRQADCTAPSVEAIAHDDAGRAGLGSQDPTIARKDAYMNGQQYQAAFVRAGLA